MADAFAFVLHSHLPYARGAGRWPHGEEWIHEAVLGTYLPLLVTLHDLRAAGVPLRMTIGLTPVLLDQLADRDVIHRTVQYIDDQIRRADTDRKHFVAERQAHRAELASFYSQAYRSLGTAYVARFDRDIPAAFADLAASGHVEILTSAATHGYLPLLDERTVHLQLATGRRTSRRILGIEPTGIWLPECAHRPGLEALLEAHGFTHFFTDANMLGGAATAGERMRRSPRERDRSGGALAQIALLERPPVPAPSQRTDVFKTYLVGRSDVVAVARHPEVSGQVWSASFGYPGDPQYREFHRKDTRSGLRYWRVTDVTTGLDRKAEYVPHAAAERVSAHADHFVSVVRGELDAHRARSGGDGMLTVTFDSELFGHWWFEGVDWLAAVLRRMARGGPHVTTIAERLAAVPPAERIELREGSWGKQNDHSTWVNAETAWIWDELDRMQRRFADARRSTSADELRQRALRQAARELLLASASDWPFLVTTGQAADYATERFRSHALRFHRACELARRGTADDEVELRGLEHADDPFPDLEPRDFA
ncbi:MAG: glycoside hydrolase family 57 protein [Chloroflexi bacterium]|nr:glycoside hydrolase family 57 protein [Chloroflexota bacterium]